MSCKYKIEVSCPALLTGVSAKINGTKVAMETEDMLEFSCDAVDRVADAAGKIEIYILVRGQQGATASISVTNTTRDEEIFTEEAEIGSQDGVPKTRYKVDNKKISSKC